MSWHALRRRSSVEWSVRLILAAMVGWIGYVSIIQSLAVVLPSSELERAYKLAPGNGRIAARLSEVLSGPEVTPQDRGRAARIAKDALRHDPTAVEAVATLGLDALLRGDQDAAQRLFAYSQVLSRRDFRTQLWAIEDAVAQAKIEDALKHYDIALRTKKNAPDLLYPVLANAAVYAKIQQELVKTIARRPSWAENFVDYVSSNNSDPRAVAALFHGLQEVHFPVSEAANNALINQLLAAGHITDAWSYYATVRDGVDKRRSRDFRFTAMTNRPLPFDWLPADGPGISTVIQPDPEGGIFEFSASPSVGGILLQQLQVLPEGDYLLQGHTAGVEQPSQSRPYWTLSCRGGREIGKLNVPNSAESGGSFSGRFTVPASCPVQILAFVARPSTEIRGVTGQIGQILLRPLH